MAVVSSTGFPNPYLLGVRRLAALHASCLGVSLCSLFTVLIDQDYEIKVLISKREKHLCLLNASLRAMKPLLNSETHHASLNAPVHIPSLRRYSCAGVSQSASETLLKTIPPVVFEAEVTSEGIDKTRQGFVAGHKVAASTKIQAESTFSWIAVGAIRPRKET